MPQNTERLRLIDRAASLYGRTGIVIPVEHLLRRQPVPFVRGAAAASSSAQEPSAPVVRAVNGDNRTDVEYGIGRGRAFIFGDFVEHKSDSRSVTVAARHVEIKRHPRQEIRVLDYVRLARLKECRLVMLPSVPCITVFRAHRGRRVTRAVPLGRNRLDARISAAVIDDRPTVGVARIEPEHRIGHPGGDSHLPLGDGRKRYHLGIVRNEQ